MRRASLILAVALCTPGCMGTVSRSDGEGPFPPAMTRLEGPYHEVGGGRGGVLLSRDKGAGDLLVTGESVRPIVWRDVPSALEGARVLGDSIYRIRGGSIERLDWKGGLIEKPVELAALDEPRSFDVMRDENGEETLAVARPGCVLAGRPGKLATLWQGNPLAVELDPARQAAWIVGGAPLAAIDCVRLLDGKVLLRVPLPRELESPGVRVVISGKSVAVYALDRPIEAAILLVPEAQVAMPLLAQAVPGEGSFDDASLPPLLVPPGRFVDERLALDLPKEQHLGRVAPLPDGAFAVIDDRKDTDTLWIEVVEPPADRDSPKLQKTLHAPREWARVVEAVGWDSRAVFLVNGDRRLVVTKQGCALEENEPASDALRHGANHTINGFIEVGELGVSVVIVGGAVALLVAAIPVALVLLPFFALSK